MTNADQVDVQVERFLSLAVHQQASAKVQTWSTSSGYNDRLPLNCEMRANFASSFRKNVERNHALASKAIRHDEVVVRLALQHPNS